MEADKTWQRNAASQIVLNSIFAALAAVWITIAVQPDPKNPSITIKVLEVILSLASFFLFATSAEGSTNACEEKDVIKYVYYMLWYNVGVILIGIAIGLFLLQRFRHHFASFSYGLIFIIYLAYTGVFAALLWSWIRDSIWILWTDGAVFQDYLKELSDGKKPERSHGCVMRFVFRSRLR
jgi:hypothetical protein